MPSFSNPTSTVSHHQFYIILTHYHFRFLPFLTPIFQTCFSLRIHLLSRRAPPFVCLTAILHHHPLLFHLPHTTTTTTTVSVSHHSPTSVSHHHHPLLCRPFHVYFFLKHHRFHIPVSRTPQTTFLSPLISLSHTTPTSPSIRLTHSISLPVCLISQCSPSPSSRLVVDRTFPFPSSSLC